MTVLVFLLLLLPQDTSELRIKYDRISNNTTVSTKTREVAGSIWITLFFNHAGTKLEEPKKMVGVIFDSYSTDWKYLRDQDQKLYVLADGERFTVANPRRESNVNSGRYPYYSRRVTMSERLIFEMTSEQLAVIAKSSSVEMRLGPERFSLGKDTLRAFRQFYAAMQP